MQSRNEKKIMLIGNEAVGSELLVSLGNVWLKPQDIRDSEGLVKFKSVSYIPCDAFFSDLEKLQSTDLPEDLFAIVYCLDLSNNIQEVPHKLFELQKQLPNLLRFKKQVFVVTNTLPVNWPSYIQAYSNSNVQLFPLDTDIHEKGTLLIKACNSIISAIESEMMEFTDLGLPPSSSLITLAGADLRKIFADALDSCNFLKKQLVQQKLSMLPYIADCNCHQVLRYFLVSPKYEKIFKVNVLEQIKSKFSLDLKQEDVEKQIEELVFTLDRYVKERPSSRYDIIYELASKLDFKELKYLMDERDCHLDEPKPGRYMFSALTQLVLDGNKIAEQFFLRHGANANFALRAAGMTANMELRRELVRYYPETNLAHYYSGYGEARQYEKKELVIDDKNNFVHYLIGVSLGGVSSVHGKEEYLREQMDLWIQENSGLDTLLAVQSKVKCFYQNRVKLKKIVEEYPDLTIKLRNSHRTIYYTQETLDFENYLKKICDLNLFYTDKDYFNDLLQEITKLEQFVHNRPCLNVFFQEHADRRHYPQDIQMLKQFHKELNELLRYLKGVVSDKNDIVNKKQRSGICVDKLTLEINNWNKFIEEIEELYNVVHRIMISFCSIAGYGSHRILLGELLGIVPALMNNLENRKILLTTIPEMRDHRDWMKRTIDEECIKAALKALIVGGKDQVLRDTFIEYFMGNVGKEILLYAAAQAGDVALVERLLPDDSHPWFNKLLKCAINGSVYAGNADMLEYLYNKRVSHMQISISEAFESGNVGFLNYLLGGKFETEISYPIFDKSWIISDKPLVQLRWLSNSPPAQRNTLQILYYRLSDKKFNILPVTLEKAQENYKIRQQSSSPLSEVVKNIPKEANNLLFFMTFLYMQHGSKRLLPFEIVCHAFNCLMRNADKNPLEQSMLENICFFNAKALLLSSQKSYQSSSGIKERYQSIDTREKLQEYVNEQYKALPKKAAASHKATYPGLISFWKDAGTPAVPERKIQEAPALPERKIQEAPALPERKPRSMQPS